jgi:Domain of unknown function (DUF4815)
MPITLPDYYNRYDESKNFEEHLFRAGFLAQSAEINEIQTSLRTRIQRVADGIYKDGDVVRDARIIVDPGTGVTICESGAIYLSGAVRGIPTGNLTVSIVGSVIVGIYLQESEITEVEDTTLLNPAVGIRGFQEPGAARLKVDPIWGYLGDGQSGDFFPVYEVLDGLVKSKEAPPALDSVLQSIARYDRDSTGGTYVITGFNVSDLGDSGSDQVYSISQGRARVHGHAVEFAASRRLVYTPDKDQSLIDNEPKTSTTASAQRIDLNWTPIANLVSVTITAEKTVAIVHGAFTGAIDPLPDTGVVSIEDVNQSSTTYVDPTDYVLSSDSVDWSPAGAEIAPGSTYNVTYRYLKEVVADVTGVDATGFTVTGAVTGTTITTDYNFYLPRIDRICLTANSDIVVLRGIPNRLSPRPPTIPNTLLALCTISQTWDATKRVINDGIKLVPMNRLNAMDERLVFLFDLIAEQRLLTDASLRESIAKKGALVDPFTNDSMRDLGLTQTAVISDGVLTLAMTATPYFVSADVSAWTTGAHTEKAALKQTAITGSMKVNPYSSVALKPSKALLNPSADRWTLTVDRTTVTTITTRLGISWMARRFLWGWWSWWWLPGWWTARPVSTVVANTNVQTTVNEPDISDAQFMRSLEVKFDLEGFAPNEVVTATFDGVTVTLSTP